MPFNPETCLPADHQRAQLVGRMWAPEYDGPVVVRLDANGVYDLTQLAPTMRDLLELPDLVRTVSAFRNAPRLAALHDVLANSHWDRRDRSRPFLLAPCDLQAIKAAGVTFIKSLLERVIEERTSGDSSKAAAIRQTVETALGTNLPSVRPGSDEASRLKDILIAEGMWSQYLEVGIGPDAEIFTKSQPMSAVGLGAEIGIHRRSEWNNPEPEIVLAVNSRGAILGATLGNDVNLRDFEGRSALLLGKAKDNNASCAIGPFVRLFDDTFKLDDVRRCEVTLRVKGEDGFTLAGSSNMSLISRDPVDLVGQAIGPNHQYPDGVMLFLGTMFAPTEDRGAVGRGFTHVIGDQVVVASERLGALINRVNFCDRIEPWTFGVGALMHNLGRRGLL